jgi:hypothetical protein
MSQDSRQREGSNVRVCSTVAFSDPLVVIERAGRVVHRLTVQECLGHIHDLSRALLSPDLGIAAAPKVQQDRALWLQQWAVAHHFLCGCTGATECSWPTPIPATQNEVESAIAASRGLLDL